jgi:hypothetical protein
MAELEAKKFQSRFTDEMVDAVRFTGDQEQLIDILNWVTDNGGRAQGEFRDIPGMDLKVHERGVGLVLVKPGEYILKTGTGFEVHPVLAFSQMYKKVSPVSTIIKKPVVLEAMQFTGGVENENDLEAWLAESNHKGTFRHSIRGTTIRFYRIELADGSGSIDIPLNSWIVKVGSDLKDYNEAEYAAVYQEVKI